MIRSSLKVFLKNLVFVFIPMGIVYLFLLLTVFYLISSVLGSAGGTLSRLTSLIDLSATESSASVNEFLAYSFEKIVWNGSLFDAVRQILDTDWLSETVNGFFHTLNVSTTGFEAQFNAILGDFASDLVSCVSVSAVTCVVGVILANYATRFAIRRRSARRDWKKFLLAHIVVPLAQAAVIVVTLGLFSVIRLYSLLVFFVMLLLSGAISLATAWLLHGSGKLRLREVLTFKNIMARLAVVGIVALLNAVLAVLLYLVNPFLSVLLMIPFLLYSFNIADLNTEAYVCSLAEKREEGTRI